MRPLDGERKVNSGFSQAFRNGRNALRRFVPWLFVLGKWLTLLFSGRSFLRRSGYFRSVAANRPVRQDGSPIPWMNYPVIGFLDRRLAADQALFEYGCGNSTLFYASRVGSVIAVEDDPAWHEAISRRLPPNARVTLCSPLDPDADAGSIAGHGRRFDVVVIDGKVRRHCLAAAPDWLTDGGVMLLDDVNDAEHAEGIEATRRRGFRVLEFEGLKPGSIRLYRTLLFYRPGNCLGL